MLALVKWNMHFKWTSGTRNTTLPVQSNTYYGSLAKGCQLNTHFLCERCLLSHSVPVFALSSNFVLFVKQPSTRDHLWSKWQVVFKTSHFLASGWQINGYRSLKSAEINTDSSFADTDCFPSVTGLLALRIETHVFLTFWHGQAIRNWGLNVDFSSF